jgi:carbon monoxide dehydrogenase subunit G
VLTALVVAALVIVALLAYVATRPGSFRVERTATIGAPPAHIAGFITDFRRWALWSPYEHIDPSMSKKVSGAPSGVGAVYEWSGNGKAGAGRMEIVEPASASRIAIRMDFFKPFKARNLVTFTLVPEGAATRVTWAMDGPAPFMSKLMGVFINMDHMIGKDFAIGLENLKAVAEKPLA